MSESSRHFQLSVVIPIIVFSLVHVYVSSEPNRLHYHWDTCSYTQIIHQYRYFIVKKHNCLTSQFNNKKYNNMPPKAAPKKKGANGYKLAPPLPKGLVLEDIAKKKWLLGSSIGQGGFGEIYSAQEDGSKSKDYPYVIKIEPHGNGPLFVEMHFYIRNSKKEDIENFKSERGLKTLGMPIYLGSGSHEYNGDKYRFLVMEKYGIDLWKIFLENNKIFPKSTVFKIAIQILDVLEYIHSRGYVHADVKGANILMGTTKATQNKQVYLVDFGLASKITSDEEFKPNPKKAHDGTIEYLSRDAHKGVPTMRGDLEVLAYNIIHWLGCTLPWEKNLSDPIVVQKSKEENMEKTEKLTKVCFAEQDPPGAIVGFLKYINKLKFNDEPDYQKIRDMFLKELDGDAVGKPFQFSILSKTPQKRVRSENAGKSPIRKVSKKKVTKIENPKQDNEDEDDNDHSNVIEEPVKTTVGKRGRTAVNYAESPVPMIKKKGTKLKKPSKLANSPKSKIPEDSTTGYTDAMKEILAKKVTNGKASKMTNGKVDKTENSQDGYTEAMKEVLAKKVAKSKSKTNEAKAASSSKRKKNQTKEEEDSSE